MKIKSDSFLEKYVIEFWQTRPKGLCWFFWKVVATVLIQIAAILLAALSLFYLLRLATYPLWAYFLDYSPATPFESAVLWVGVGVYITSCYRQFLRDTGEIAPKPPKEPGLVTQYVSAVHHKICPRMEYEREPGFSSEEWL